MELNEIHTEHEHATTSMKVLLLIFSLVVIGALSYMVMMNNRETDTTDYSSPQVKKEAAMNEAEETDATAAVTAVDCGDKAYAFSLTFGNLWNGYKIKKVTPDDALVTCYFTMPTTSTDKVWATATADHDGKYASLFAVSVYTPTQWTAAQAEANKPAELGHNTAYYWGWAPAQAYPDDLATVAADAKNVVGTFEIVE